MNTSEIINQVSERQPRLRCAVRNDNVEFVGKFILNSPLGEFDTYDIRLVIPNDFPQRQPRVWETAGRLPRDIDRHIYGDGECCITVWESWLVGSEHVSLRDFIDGPLFNFFLAQHQVESGQGWPFGEWRHGVSGRVDALADSLRLQSNSLSVARFLIASADVDLRSSDNCPCGSGRRMARCHPREVARSRDRLGPQRLISIARELVDQRLALEKRAKLIENIRSKVQIEIADPSSRTKFLQGSSLLALSVLLTPDNKEPE